MDLTYENVKKEQQYLEDYRKDYEPLKRICCDMAYPERVGAWDWQFGATGISTKGKKNTSRIKRVYDPTATKAFDIWGNGVLGHYTHSKDKWFSSELYDRQLYNNKNVRQYFHDVDDHLSFVLRNSGSRGSGNNYYIQKFASIRDGGCIGDSFMYINEDEDGKLMFQTCHPNEFWLRRDYWGRIVTIHHKTVCTMRELVDEFGMKALNKDQAILFRDDNFNKKDDPITVIHGVYKNKDYENKSGVKYMRWQHVWINVEGKHKISQTGSKKLNPVPWSLNRPSSEMYGRGVIGSMLVEILTANFIAKDMLQASSVAVRPPMLMTQTLRHKLDMGAGAVNFVNNKEMQGVKMGDLVARMIDSTGYPFGVDQQSFWQGIINDRLGVSLFLALNMEAAQGYKNVEHIESAKVERAILYMSLLNTLDNGTDMELDRVLDLELEAKRAPQLPPILEYNNKLLTNTNFIGPLHQLLRRHYQTGPLMQTIAYMREVMSIDPDAALVVEGDELARRILRGSNTPEEIIRSEQDVQEIRAIAAQQAEDNRQMELLAQGASAVPDLSKRIESDSVLGKVA